MIDFAKYNIKIVAFSTYPSGIWPPEYKIGEGAPFIVTQSVWLRQDENGHVLDLDWKRRDKIIYKWCEKHRGKSLIVNDMSIFGIRYAIVPDTEAKGQTHAA